MQNSSNTSARNPLSADYIEQALEQWMEIEFTKNRVDDLAALIAGLLAGERSRGLVMGWVGSRA